MTQQHLLALLWALLLVPLTLAQTYSASITWYGSGDTNKSPTCNSNTTACGFYSNPGYSVGVSQNLFGVGPGAGLGPACGKCLKITGYTDSSGNKLKNYATSIFAVISNLCPAAGNPLCAQDGLNGTNQYGTHVSVDLCADSGAKDAFFGSDGVGLAIGTAELVNCADWKGMLKYDNGMVTPNATDNPNESWSGSLSQPNTTSTTTTASATGTKSTSSVTPFLESAGEKGTWLLQSWALLPLSLALIFLL